MADGALSQTRTLEAAASAPHNLDAEQALLGAILFDNETYNRISAKLQAKHFYDPVHGRIFAACAAKIATGALADGVTLREQFAKDGSLAEIGGAAYLLTLLENAARLTIHAQQYADLVYDLSLRRELIRVGGEIVELAENPPEEASAAAIIEEAERTLFSLAESGTASAGFSPFSHALTNSINVAAAAYERKTDVSGIATGFIDLDRLMGGLHRSDLVIIAGRPSMGKTAFATNIATNIARARNVAQQSGRPIEESTNPGGVVAFFSLEMSAEQLATRILSDSASVEANRIRQGKIQKDEYEKLFEAAANMQALPLHIDETGGISISQLQARARRLQRTVGLDVIVVDYLQLVTTPGNRSDGRVQEVSMVTQGLKALAKDLKVPVIALSQLSRQVESREDKRPQLSDLRESGSIEQDADIVMFVYREAYYLSRTQPSSEDKPLEYKEWMDKMRALENRAEIVFGKNRHGPIDTINLFFEGRFTRFGNLSERD